MSMSEMDRLALVSKVLMDSRCLELKRENERLKLRLFWIDHSINMLKKLMFYANNRRSGPWCRCRTCMCTKRYYPSYADDCLDEARKFGPWFERIVQEHGLVFASSSNNEHFPCDPDPEYYPKPDASVHFLLFPFDHAPVTTWYSWVYGSKLWKAQTTQDPQLLKLTALFKTLHAIHDAECLVEDTHESDSE